MILKGNEYRGKFLQIKSTMAGKHRCVANDETNLLLDKKRDQGYHECEVLGNSKHEAVESSIAWSKCKKNPGHHQFIPATEFSLSDLPQWCRKPLILDYVKFQCAMTVKLRVKYNSWGRPNGYCFSNFRGTSLAHFGSGLFLGMSYESGPCQCYDCEHSLSPHQTFYKLEFEGQVGASPNMRWKNLCLVVAHPHGQPKKVTLGEMKSCTSAGRLHQKQFTYSTDTCPGSSGAFMLLLEFYEAIRDSSKPKDTDALDKKWVDSDALDKKWVDSNALDKKWVDSDALDKKWIDSDALDKKRVDSDALNKRRVDYQML
ncbi:hypothetical protein RRG08_059753 [Elysia crispata]|uniref:Uncharacterized protein n=1 Tax=Elysia crispata TaxID=231223 RepID=A0AAE1BD00_9GAST|nr:hypothetical protein RRG08_059753 [Elysia crispata]